MRSPGTGPHKSPRGAALVPLDTARNHESPEPAETQSARLPVLLGSPVCAWNSPGQLQERRSGLPWRLKPRKSWRPCWEPEDRAGPSGQAEVLSIVVMAGHGGNCPITTV